MDIMESLFNPSFLPTQGHETRQKLEHYAQLYATYTTLIEVHASAMRHNPQKLAQAYDRVAAEFAAEQAIAKNVPGSSFVLADLNEYARRCRVVPKTFEE